MREALGTTASKIGAVRREANANTACQQPVVIRIQVVSNANADMMSARSGNKEMFSNAKRQGTGASERGVCRQRVTTKCFTRRRRVVKTDAITRRYVIGVAGGCSRHTRLRPRYCCECYCWQAG